MGYWKEKALEYEDRGYGEVPDTYVCHECFGDKGISDFIHNNGKQKTCSYCDKENLCLPLEDVVEHIVTSLKYEWQDPVEDSPYESREGGYLNDYLTDTWDLLDEVEPIYAETEVLFEDVFNSIGMQDWARSFVIPFKEYELLGDWAEFTRQIQHKMRFSIFYKSNYLAATISSIADIIHDLKMETLYSGKIYRVQTSDKNENFNSASRMGTVPDKFAIQANRMSPAGIAMFYGSFDESTAIAEVVTGKNIYVHKAVFVPSVPLNLIDLTKMPPIPSIYDENTGSNRHYYRFIRHFIKDLAQPIKRDGNEHVEYIPTQVITEFLRYNYQINGKPIDGILYPSAVNTVNNGSSLVLFVKNDACVDHDLASNKLYLKLIKYSKHFLIENYNS